MTNNKVPFTITETDLADIKAGIQTLQTKLLPYLATLSPAERRNMPKMGDKTVGFVMKTQEYCNQNSELVPQFLDIRGFNADVTTFEQIRAIYQPLLQINDALWDTQLLLGSEAFSASLKFYNAVKQAAKSQVQKAETIYNDLTPRFPGRPKKAEPEITQANN